MSNLIMRWYAYVMVLVFSIGILYGGLFPTMISSDSWELVALGILFAAATLVPVGFGINLIWDLTNKIYTLIREKK